MPPKQEDKCPSLEELKAATTAIIGMLQYASSIIDIQNLPPELQEDVQELKEKAALLIGLMRREIIAEQKLLQLQLEEIEKAFNPPGERGTRK